MRVTHPSANPSRQRFLGVCALILFIGLITMACSSSDELGERLLLGQDARIGGEVLGLGSEGLVLDLNEAESLGIETAGNFQFDTELSEGESYTITIQQQPEGQHCEIINGSGVVEDSHISDVRVDCPIELTAKTDIMQIRLNWIGPESIDIHYSSDPDCDWSNHSLCDDAGSIIAADGNQALLGAVENGLDPDSGLFFIAGEDSLQSALAAARPSPPAFNQVQSITVTDDRIIAGGSFNRIMLATGGGLTLRLEDAKPVGTLPAIAGVVHAVHADGEGGWYIGGNFDRVGSHPRSNLARIHVNGAVDTDWAPESNDTVRALTVANGRVYIGGEFTEVESDGSQANRERLAAFDAQNGEIDLEWAPAVDDRVLTLEPRDDLILAGGEFTQVNSATNRASLAAFDESSGEVDPDWNPGTDGSVSTILVTPDWTFIGGEFTQLDNETRQNIARLDNSNDDVDLNWVAAVNGEVETITLSDDRVYVGGRFSEAGDGEARELFAAFHRDTGTLDPDWQPDVFHGLSVRSLLHHEGHIYAGGSFTITHDDGLLGQLVRLDDRDGVLDADWDIPVSGSAPNTLSLSGARLFVGGFINAAGGPVRHRLAAFDRETGIPAPDIAPVIDDPREGKVFIFVETTEAVGDLLYLGGRFLEIDGEPRENIAAIDLDSGELVPDWNPGANSRVNTMAATSERLYVGGVFSEIGADNQERDNLAAFDLDTGLLSTQWNPGANNEVNSLATDGEKVFAGGSFTHAGDETRSRLAAFAADTGALDDDWGGSVSSTVEALVLEDGRLYAGGRFTTAGDENDDREKLAAFDTDSGVLLSWNPAALGGNISDLAMSQEWIIAAGSFDQIGDDDRERLAAIDASSGAAIPSWTPESSGTIRTVTADGDLVVIGGNFRRFNGMVRPAFAIVDAETGELLW